MHRGVVDLMNPSTRVQRAGSLPAEATVAKPGMNGARRLHLGEVAYCPCKYSASCFVPTRR